MTMAMSHILIDEPRLVGEKKKTADSNKEKTTNISKKIKMKKRFTRFE